MSDVHAESDGAGHDDVGGHYVHSGHDEVNYCYVDETDECGYEGNEDDSVDEWLG